MSSGWYRLEPVAGKPFGEAEGDGWYRLVPVDYDPSADPMDPGGDQMLPDPRRTRAPSPHAPVAGKPNGDRTLLGDIAEGASEVGSQLLEVPKGVPGGAISAVGTAMQGVSALGRRYAPPSEYHRLLDDIALHHADPQRRGEILKRIHRPDESLRYWLGSPDKPFHGRRGRVVSALRDAQRGDLGLLSALRAEADDHATPVKDRPLWQAGQRVVEYGRGVLPAAPGYEESFGRQVGEGLGSMATGVGLAAIPGAGPAAATGLFALMGAGEAADRAMRDGADDEQLTRAATFGLGAGATDLLPVQRLLRAFPTPAQETVGGLMRRFGGRRVMRALGRIGEQALLEAVQEGGQQFLQNLIAREIYKPAQSLDEGIWENTAVGAAVGGIAGMGREGVAALARRRSQSSRGERARAVRDLPPPTPEDEASPIPTETIQEGREEVADAQATEAANRVLGSVGLPEVGAPVRWVVGGEAAEGVITDGWQEESGDAGVTITFLDDTTLDITRDEIATVGGEIVRLPDPAPMAEIEAGVEAERAAAAEESAPVRGEPDAAPRDAAVPVPELTPEQSADVEDLVRGGAPLEDAIEIAVAEEPAGMEPEPAASEPQSVAEPAAGEPEAVPVLEPSAPAGPDALEPEAVPEDEAQREAYNAGAEAHRRNPRSFAAPYHYTDDNGLLDEFRRGWNDESERLRPERQRKNAEKRAERQRKNRESLGIRAPEPEAASEPAAVEPEVAGERDGLPADDAGMVEISDSGAAPAKRMPSAKWAGEERQVFAPNGSAGNGPSHDCGSR